MFCDGLIYDGVSAGVIVSDESSLREGDIRRIVAEELHSALGHVVTKDLLDQRLREESIAIEQRFGQTLDKHINNERSSTNTRFNRMFDRINRNSETISSMQAILAEIKQSLTHLETLSLNVATLTGTMSNIQATITARDEHLVDVVQRVASVKKDLGRLDARMDAQAQLLQRTSDLLRDDGSRMGLVTQVARTADRVVYQSEQIAAHSVQLDGTTGLLNRAVENLNSVSNWVSQQKARDEARQQQRAQLMKLLREIGNNSAVRWFALLTGGSAIGASAFEILKLLFG